MANDAVSAATTRGTGGRVAATVALVAALAVPASADARLTALTTAHGARGAAVSRAVAVARLSPLAGGRTSLVAGNLSRGFDGDGSVATFAELNEPAGLAVDRAGNLLIADLGNLRVRKVDTRKPFRFISTVAGDGVSGLAGDGGRAVNAQMIFPNAVAAAPDGGFYISGGNLGTITAPVRKVTAAGIIQQFAGSSVTGYAGDHGPAVNALMDHPAGVASDTAGNVYIAEGFRVRKVDPAGIITTYAGGAIEGFSGDGGPATAATLERPTAVAVDPHGVVYVATGNRVRKITPGGIITTIAGTGFAAPLGDGGPAIHAALASPSALAADGAGNVYIADTGHELVRAVDASGVIRTIAGRPTGGLTLYGPATDTAIFPDGLALDGHGRLYVSDLDHQIVRAIDPPLSTAAAGQCTKSAARQLVERAHLGGFTGSVDQPVAKVLCGPFLGRHSRAMIVSLSRETCIPAGGWVVFRKVGRSWRRVKSSLGLFNMVFRHGTTGFTEEIPNPRKTEPTCTTRRWLGRNWHWNGKRLVHGRFHRVKAPTHV